MSVAVQVVGCSCVGARASNRWFTLYWSDSGKRITAKRAWRPVTCHNCGRKWRVFEGAELQRRRSPTGQEKERG